MNKISLTGFGKFQGRTTTRKPEKNDRKAAILHLDIVGSTQLVKQNMYFAHHRIRQLYHRISEICLCHTGIARELRGDAVVAEFDRAEDAINTAIAIQSMDKMIFSHRLGRLNPPMRIGISYGKVIGHDNVITGLAVIRAQRLEQLTETGCILVDNRIYDQSANDIKQSLDFRTRTHLKGIEELVDVYQVMFSPNYRPLSKMPEMKPEEYCA